MSQLRCCWADTPEGRKRVPYRLRRSPRSREMLLTVWSDRLPQISLPPDTTEKEAEKFLIENMSWVWKNLRGTVFRTHLLPYLKENPVLFVGRTRYRLTVEATSGTQAEMWIDEEQPEVILRYPRTGSPEEVLVDLLKRFARKHLCAYVKRLAQELEAPLERVSISDQMQVWGSCSEGGRISLNWRLLLLQPTHQIHIILHELAHASHLDHSRPFWRQLEQWDPAAFRHDAEVEQIAHEIMLLGR